MVAGGHWPNAGRADRFAATRTGLAGRARLSLLLLRGLLDRLHQGVGLGLAQDPFEGFG